MVQLKNCKVSIKKTPSGGSTITLGNFWTEWCYSGHFVIFPDFHVPGVKAVISLTEFQSALCYSGHFAKIRKIVKKTRKKGVFKKFFV